jgi:hypothetical protein
MTSIRTRFVIWLGIVCLICFAAGSVSASVGEAEARDGATNGVLAPSAAPWSTVDHSKLEALQQDFDSGPEVTEACLSCHNEAAKQVQQTIHWTWICPADPQGVMGKNGLTMNNF